MALSFLLSALTYTTNVVYIQCVYQNHNLFIKTLFLLDVSGTFDQKLEKKF